MTLDPVNLNELINKKFNLVYQEDESVVFENDNEKLILMHEQDCCEAVWIEDINGDLKDLEDTIIYFAYESINTDENYLEWSFYHFSSHKGTVTIRFCGEESNYSTDARLFRELD